MINRIQIQQGTKTSDILFFKETDLSEFPDKQIIPLFGANGSGKSTFIDAISSDIKGRKKLAGYVRKYKETMQSLNGSIEVINKMKSPFTGKEYSFSQYNETDYKEMMNERKESFKKDRQATCDIPVDEQTGIVLWRNAENNLADNGFMINDPYNYERLSLYYDAESLSEGQSLMFSVMEFLDILLKEEEIHQPGEQNIILLDEIDSGLSIDNIDSVCRKIKRIVKKWDNTQIFMSFNSPEVIKFFPYVLSMYDGKLHKIDSYEAMSEEIHKNKKILDKARKTSKGKYRIYA